MADKITPPSKPVADSGGVKMPSEHTTVTTPNPTFGRYFGTGHEGATGQSVADKKGGSIMGSA